MFNSEDAFVWVGGETGVWLKYRKSCSNSPSLSLCSIFPWSDILDSIGKSSQGGSQSLKKYKMSVGDFFKRGESGRIQKSYFLHFSDCGLLLNYSPAWRASKLIVLIYFSIFVNIRRANNEVLDQAGECEGLTFLISRVLAKIKKPKTAPIQHIFMKAWKSSTKAWSHFFTVLSIIPYWLHLLGIW